MANCAFLTVSFCLLVLCNSCLAARPSRQLQQQQQQYQQGECRIQNLNPLEPNRQIQHEAGITEIWDQNNDQMQCTSVAATRHQIESRGLLLPSFNNAPMLVYVLQGQGILGASFPGCPETYQSFQQTERSSRDQHQKIHRIRRGDIVALPAGVAHWAYNGDNDQLVLVVIHDTKNNDNQLDQNLRILPCRQLTRPTRRKLARARTDGPKYFTDILAEAFNVNMEAARRVQNEDDKRGFIVRVEGELQVARPRRSQEEEEEEREYKSNGLEETICTMRITENIADPEWADVYTARGGRISTLNSHNLPILRNIQLSAERGVLYKNGIFAPHWNINAHSIMYVTRGSGRIQIVGNSNRPAFDGQVRQGQLLIIPQNFAVLKQAGDEGLEWSSVKTNDRAMISPLSGRTSVIRAIPVDVLANAHQISKDEAMRLKYNREELTVHTQRSHSQQRPSTWAIV